MNVALIYCSPHGRTRKVVTEALRELAVRPDVFDLAEGEPHEALGKYDRLIVFCPTYGDEELPAEMEDYVRRLKLDLTGKQFAICELGNYYGYDDFSFGAMAIIRHRLLEQHATEFCPPLSLDSLPKVNWNQLSRWVAVVNTRLNRHD